MAWYVVLLPAAIIAYAIRLEAILIGPYYSWIQLVHNWEDEAPETRRMRTRAFARRVALPLLALLVLGLVWPNYYAPEAGALVGGLAGLLLLWPLVFRGFPTEVSRPHAQVWGIYGTLVIALSLSGFVGASMAEWIRTEQGGLGTFLKVQGFEILFGGILLLFMVDGLSRWVTKLARQRDAEREANDL